MTSRVLVALGGNARLRRGEPLAVATQTRAARLAARLLTQAAAGNQLVITHGNGPQVGLLASMHPADPLDVLDAETEGQIGYLLALELGNAIPEQDAVAVLTRVVVDVDDPAFSTPTKPIGPDHTRVVASPEPLRIVELKAIRQLVDSGFLVICAGGGGIPVVEERGRLRGVEAVIDKDLASARLAIDLPTETLVLATDVDAVYTDYGTASQRAIARATPDGLRSLAFAPGSMGPKVEAVCRFVERTGGRAAIGALHEIDKVMSGRAGTQVRPDGVRLQYQKGMVINDRAA
jgi:carbamate kinase